MVFISFGKFYTVGSLFSSVFTLPVLLCACWVNSTPAYLSPRMKILNLGRAFNEMHLITVLPGRPLFSHLYFCLPHVSYSLILQSWQPICLSPNPQPTQPTSRLVHMPSICPLFFASVSPRLFPLLSPIQTSNHIMGRASAGVNLKQAATYHQCSLSPATLFFCVMPRQNQFLLLVQRLSQPSSNILLTLPFQKHHCRIYRGG